MLAQPAPAEGEEELGEGPQEPAAPAAAAEPEPEPPPAAPPAPPPPPAGPAAPVMIPDGEPPPGPIAPAFPPAIPSIDYGARMRIALKLQDPMKQESMNDLGMQVDSDIYMSGAIHRMFKWSAGVTISYSGAPGASAPATVAPLDVIARFEPIPEFNIYMGRMIVVADRFTPSGPWGMDEFFYVGMVGPYGLSAAALQKSGPTGRDLGVNIWGALMGGHVKYYLGAYQFQDPRFNPLLSGRLQVSLLNPEPAFYQRTTYFGTKDFVSIGVGGQYQKACEPGFQCGSVGPAMPPAMMGGMPGPNFTDDFTFFTADLVLDKNIGDSGTISLYGAYSMFGGDYNKWENYWVASLGYMLPKPIGIGKIRFNARYQRAQDHIPEDADASSILDFQISYNIMPWFARIQLGFRRSEMYAPANAATMAPAQLVAGNQIYLGVTLADP
ncbi:MAG TPA: hypothetical protein VJV78_12950 [Polyangiales bacterium]|nr:hypothetical protein [Polyangiales bacterium]